jgi:CBS domain-containing protein
MQRKIIPGVISGEQALSCLPPTASAKDAADMMRAAHVGAVMVVDHGKLVGIVTERDLVYRVLAGGLDAARTGLAQVMTANPRTLSPDDLALNAFKLMVEGRYRHLPVLRDGEVCGMVSIRDLYEAVRRTLEEELHNAEALIYGEQYGTATTV